MSSRSRTIVFAVAVALNAGLLGLTAVAQQDQPQPMAEQASRRRVDLAALWAQIEPLRGKLLAARDLRERPKTDDKVLADWNGLAISGLANAGRLLGEPAWIEHAAQAADFVLTRMRADGAPLRHVWRAGEAKIPAFLSDYAYFVRGLLALDRSSGDPRWLAAARELVEEQERRLGDAKGGYFAAAASPSAMRG